MHRTRTYVYYLLLFLTAVLAMLPVAQLIHPLKYDIIDQAYPWRYFIGECLQEGILPLWNPYQLLGSPIHADPQSAAWYPLTWFFGYFFGYDIYILSIDFLLHIFLAGTGMFWLGRLLKFRDETAFLMGVSYMLSGFFIGNAQHFMWVISGTWIPFIIGAFIQLKEQASLPSAVRLGLAFFMLMTGGYPAFMILLLYLLLAVFILYLAGFLRKKDYAALRKYLKYLSFAVVFTLLAGMVVLVSVWHLRDAITRGDGVTLQQALFGAFTPRSFISFILPYASIRDMEFYGTDLSMSNAYFGLIMLLFFITGLMVRKSNLIRLFLVWGIFCLAAAVGSALPLRAFLYDYIPFMNLFRFPALFRIFFILSFIIVAANAFDQWITEPGKLKGKVYLSLMLIALTIIGFIVYAAIGGELNLAGFIKNQFIYYSKTSTIRQHIFSQGVIQLALLILFYILITKWNKARYALAGIILAGCIELIGASRLNGPYTVYTQHFSSKEIKAHSRKFPEGFPLPGNEPLIGNRDTKGIAFQALWRNLNIFHKQVSYEGYNPLHLKGFEEMADNQPLLFEAILQNPLVYLADQACPADSLVLHREMQDFRPGRVYFEEMDYKALTDVHFRKSDGDTARIIGFSPVEINIIVKTKDKALVNLLQNNYHGWKATVDSRPADILTGNMSFMSVLVPAGEHSVSFYYDPSDVIAAFWVSLFTILAGLFCLIFYYFKGVK